MTLMMLDDKEKQLIIELVDKFEKSSTLETKQEISETIKAMVD